MVLRHPKPNPRSDSQSVSPGTPLVYSENKAFEEPKKKPTYTITDWEQVDDIVEEVAYKLLNQEEE